MSIPKKFPLSNQAAIKMAEVFSKLGFVPSPQVQQQLQQMQPPADPAAAGGAPPDPAAAAAGAPPADPAAGGGAPPPGVDPATGQSMPAATLEDVMAGLEQLAQMISQIPQMVAAAAPAGGEQKKKSPAERMEAIEATLAQLTGQPPAGGAPAGAPPADPAAGGAPAPAAPPAA